MGIGFAERSEAFKSGKKGVFKGKIGIFGAKKGQKRASLFTDQ